MGKSGDLWDDSALLKAFDGAVSKYKKMHGLSGVTEGEIVDNNTEEKLPTAEADNRSSGLVDNNTEHVKKDDGSYADAETTAKIGETANNLHLLQITENPSLEMENHAMESHNVQSQNEAAWGSINEKEYNQLLSKYYEIEDQRQKILQQLNQCNNWNYQNPISDTSTSEEYYRASLPQQPYDTVTCYCSYGCQNWVVPCNSLTASCPDAICKDARKPHSVSNEESDIVKTAMDAAKRAVSSITRDASIKADVSANEGNSVEITAQSTESSKTETDLAAVLNAWYSAGFYTGKYLSEQQSVEKKIKRGNGL
ncbi:hypothetical protein ACP275_05G071200 [Erythranthe tilingii]